MATSPAPQPATLTQPAWLAWARSLYLAAGKSPGRELFDLWAHVTDSADYLYAPRTLTIEQAQRFAQLVRSRVEGVPLQHLLGKMWFRGLELCAGPGCFIVRPETELLVEIAQRELDARFALSADGALVPSDGGSGATQADGRTEPSKHSLASILQPLGSTPRALSVGAGSLAGPLLADLCSGSGAIALALAQLNPAAHICAAEISAASSAYAHRNLAAHSELSQRICYRLADATDASALLKVFDVPAGSFHLIVTNPPYVPTGQVTQVEALADPELALYGGEQDGLDIPSRLLDVAYELLLAGGVLAMEHDDAQGAELVRLARQAGFESARTECDLAGRDRFLVARKAG